MSRWRGKRRAAVSLFLPPSLPPSLPFFLPRSTYVGSRKKRRLGQRGRKRKVTLDRLMVGSGCHGGSEGRVRPPEIGLSLFERPREPHGGLGFRACFHSFRWLLSSMAPRGRNERTSADHASRQKLFERNLLQDVGNR